MYKFFCMIYITMKVSFTASSSSPTKAPSRIFSSDLLLEKLRHANSGNLSWAFAVILSTALVIQSASCHYFTNYYAAHIIGGPDVARSIAEKHGFIFVDQIMTDYYHLKHQRVARRSVLPNSDQHKDIAAENEVKWIQQQVAKRRVKRDVEAMFNDPLWPKQWYLNRGPGLDMNVMPAYKWQITGKGVVVSILDDGIEKDHPDLVKNYDPGASFDVNGRDNDPQPRYDITNENRHGTRCAGEVAAEANNNICTVGVAYNARIGGVRMLDGDVTDAVEAQSLSLNIQHIDIFSASWGPDDDGATVDGPGPLARVAFLSGIKQGRRGLGSIFVWASGNGGSYGDNCNCDGYTNSIYTLSISSASENGRVPWYSEACSSTLATTYSSGTIGERQIITTDLHHSCTEGHTGTSASAPLAAGVCALVLEANPQLTWRDLQHIVVLTAQPANLKADDWVQNGAGRNVSHHFGFGLLDAAAMVEMAMDWRTVPEQRRCQISPPNFTERSVPTKGMVEVSLTSDACDGDVRYLEHVEAVITLSATVRGQLSIYLKSPAGTRSMLLSTRDKDRSPDGFNVWPFMTTHNWGESPVGTWQLEVRNADSVAVLKNWSLVFYGTKEDPQPPRTGKRHLLPANADKGGCGQSEYLLAPFCYTECPKSYYGTNETIKMSNGTIGLNGTNSTSDDDDDGYIQRCSSCHRTCQYCFGPAENQCTNCSVYLALTVDNRCVEVERSAAASWRLPGNVIALISLAGFLILCPVVTWLVIVQCRAVRGSAMATAAATADDPDAESFTKLLIYDDDDDDDEDSGTVEEELKEYGVLIS